MMSTQWQEPTGGMMTPPEYFGDLSEQPSTWPTVVGTISIVLGALGLLCYGCNSLSTIFSPWLASMAPPDQRPPTPPAMMQAMQVAQMCLSFLLSLWLLIAGIGLTRRRRWARSNHLGWAFAKIIYTVIGTALTIILLPQTVKMINDQMAAGGRSPQFALTEPMMMVFALVALVWFLIYPVFLIIWFSRARIKAEMREWA